MQEKGLDITKEIFKSFLLCPYKAHLLLQGESGVKTEYETVLADGAEQYLAKALKKIPVVEISCKRFRDPQFHGKEGSFYRTSLENNGMKTSCITERVRGGSALGSFHYVPVIFSANKKLSKEDKDILAYDGFVLDSIQSRRPEFGRIINGAGFKITKLRISDQVEKVHKVVARIKRLDTNPPGMMLNRHCHICEFSGTCRAKALEKDDLSLLSGIPQKEITTQNKKGIFTVTQYSYTFRPRKKFRKSYPFNLKALALRENKVHLYGTPSIPLSSVQIYLDVEGDPARDFYYLIGLVIVKNGIEKKYSFWADNETEENSIYLAFVNCIRNYSEFKLFHYGSYETKFLQKLRQTVKNEEDIQVADRMLKSAVNVLSVVYVHVFFPTYSNGLKDIGTYLGFKWTSENASGLQSLVWRKQFEITNDQTIRRKLIEYNLEDCLALERVAKLINKISRRSDDETEKHPDIICADDLKDESKHKKWGTVDFLSEDLEYINKCAYFDYQREKVFVRTNRNLQNRKKSGRFQEKRSYRINKRFITSIHRECPHCKGKLYRNGNGHIRTIYDLKFSNSGMKRWITTYETIGMRCFPCKRLMTFESFKGMPKYGHNLISWVNYQNIVGHQPFYRIQHILDDLFGLSVSGTTLQRFKSIATKYYQETYNEIIQKIKRGNFIHIDETQISFHEVSGYVWVFTNMEEVYFLYTATREGDFLKELLAGFKGVLISDFYGVYCSSEWVQQKCLIHLIRDLNDDLRNSPYDEEYKKIAKDFSSLLCRIITSIDKYGLKKRNLSKHRKDVLQFFRNLSCQRYQSDLAQKYQKRFQKNEDTLFTFLDYDGIPWNNNNAEHAIKYFADFRRIMRKGGNFTEKGLKDYLILLSIYQTCRYQGINFLKFLVSKETDINRFSQSQTRLKSERYEPSNQY